MWSGGAAAIAKFRKVTTTNLLLLSPKFQSSSILYNHNHHRRITTLTSPNCSTLTNRTQRNSPKSVSNNLNDALLSFNRMLKSRSTHSIYSLNKLLGSIVKMGEYQTVLSLIEKMQLSGFEVDVCTINIAINSYCHLNQVHFGFGLLGSIFKRGYLPNAFTFNSLLKGLFAQDKLFEAKNLFIKLVREKQIEPYLFTYGTVINGLCKSGNTSSAIGLLRNMEKQNFKANTHCQCFNILIDGTSKDGKFEIARKLFDEIFNEGVEPDVHTYTVMINGFCQEGLFDKAKELLMRMEECGCVPNDVTYNVIVQGFLKGSQCYEAVLLMEKMVKRGFTPDASTISLLVDILPTREQDPTLLDMIQNFAPKDK